jgi:Catalase
VDGVVRNLESGAPCIRKNELIDLEVEKIADPGAPETNQVVVMIGIAVEPGHRIRVVWVKFHFKTMQGIQNLTDSEAAKLVGDDRETHQRDLAEFGEFFTQELVYSAPSAVQSPSPASHQNLKTESSVTPNRRRVWLIE